MNTAVLSAAARTRRSLAPLASPWTVAALLLAATAAFDPVAFPGIAGTAAGALARTAPFIAAAVLFIAWIKAASAESLVAGAFAGRESRMIVAAALVGAIAPFCSCQVIPFIAALLAVGAPLPAVMAFWLASPLVDPPTLMITAAALGWDFALGKAVAAVGLGLMGGFALRGLIGQGAFADPLKTAPKTGCCKKKPTLATDRPQWRFWSDPARRETFRAEAVTNAHFLLKWLTLAYVLEGLLIRYIPADLVARAVGGEGLLPVVTGALVGMPAYLNGYVAPPLLAGLIDQGMSRGAAMAFLIAGPVSSIPAMAAVWALVRPPVFAAYLGFGFVGAVLGGTLFMLVG
jgi:uncharacterized protein